MWILTRSDTNQAVQLGKEVEVLYYPSSENKEADLAKLICVFVFAYAKHWFSREAAHLLPL